MSLIAVEVRLGKRADELVARQAEAEETAAQELALLRESREREVEKLERIAVALEKLATVFTNEEQIPDHAKVTLGQPEEE